MLIETHVAHVVFVSDNPSSLRVVGKVLPNKTVEQISVSDVSSDSALFYLRSRLPNINPTILGNCVKGIGGRFNDLDLFIQKIIAGHSPEFSLEEMTSRAVSELRKIGFESNIDSWVTLISYFSHLFNSGT
jgi:hypothetical protein